MRRSILFAMSLGAVVVATTALASMGGYGGGGFGGTSGFNSGQEDLSTAVRLIKQEKFAESIPYLRKVLDAHPGNADILNLLGFTSRMVGDYSNSLDYYQRALSRNPDHKGAHEYLGELYLDLHQPDQAQAQLAELARICPDGCIERDTLTKSIAAYQAAAATATTQPPPQPVTPK